MTTQHRTRRHTTDAGNWRSHAACRHADPDLFFPKPGDYVTAAEAIAVCRTCPVTDACLQDALDTRERHGIRGGLTPFERRKLPTQRRPSRRPHAARDGRQSRRSASPAGDRPAASRTGEAR
jgi:WhiB family redox-sensing transcriptional regulator